MRVEPFIVTRTVYLNWVLRLDFQAAHAMFDRALKNGCLNAASVMLSRYPDLKTSGGMVCMFDTYMLCMPSTSHINVCDHPE